MSKPAGAFSVEAAAALITAFRIGLRERAVYYLQRVRSDEMNDRDGLAAAMHEAWSAVAPRFGLKYERLEP